MVPSRLSEEDFWRCYFWRVALAKVELCNDWGTANSVRRQAQSAYDADEALLATDDPDPHSSARGAQPSDTELDAEFERLVCSPGCAVGSV
mmetsp:Transcript_71380/g.195656  ORF Transcript_71380/g.195656 Transcript_71380/m.195656 type:complete len:91 (+) Transcript_71380:549-821(+)